MEPVFLGCLSINDNTAIASYKNYTNAGVIDQKKVDAVVKDSIQKFKHQDTKRKDADPVSFRW